MSYSYQFRLKIITLVTEQDYGIREVAKLHKISHALVIYWLKVFKKLQQELALAHAEIAYLKELEALDR